MMRNDPLHAIFRKITLENIGPLVGPVPRVSLDQRFSSPAIIRRSWFDGSSRLPSFALPAVRGAIKAGTSFDCFALVQVMWVRMCEGPRERDSKIDSNDPYGNSLTKPAQRAQHTPLHQLERHKFHSDLANQTRFSAAFGRWVTLIYCDGIKAAIQQHLKGH